MRHYSLGIETGKFGPLTLGACWDDDWMDEIHISPRPIFFSLSLLDPCLEFMRQIAHKTQHPVTQASAQTRRKK
jgi:hypothetical protein